MSIRIRFFMNMFLRTDYWLSIYYSLGIFLDTKIDDLGLHL